MYVMSLPAISLRDWISVSRKGKTGGGGLVYKNGENNIASYVVFTIFIYRAVPGFCCKNPSVW